MIRSSGIIRSVHGPSVPSTFYVLYVLYVPYVPMCFLFGPLVLTFP